MNHLRILFIMIAIEAVSAFAAETASFSPDADSSPGNHVSGGPRLTLIDKIIDLGEFYPNATQSGTIRFRNSGDSPLVINSVRGNCGCTIIRFNRDSIPPDSIGVINIRFDSSGKAPGKFRKMIRIRSNSTTRIDIAYISGSIIKPPAILK